VSSSARPPNIPLAAEALLAVSGLWPKEPLSPEQERAARALPRQWQERVAAFMEQKRPSRARATPQISYLKTWDKLVAQHQDELVIAGLVDEALAAAYLAKLRTARTYLQGLWRPLSQQTLVGPRLLPPSRSEQDRAADLHGLLAAPGTILDELASYTLQEDHVAALEAVYPELAAMLDAFVDGELIKGRARRQSYEVPWPQEKMLRLFRGLPYGQPIEALPRTEPEAPKVELHIKRAEEMRTRGQTLAGQ
jgi:hypothetical protein